MRIILENVSHVYQEGTPFSAVALKDVNMEIREGEFLALIGHTGSGKSTLAQHLNGLMKPTSGRVLAEENGKLTDINEKGADRQALRRRVGLVFQYPEYQLFEETVSKDVAFGPKNMGLGQEEIDRRVREAIRRVGLDWDTVAERSPFELSGGQVRRAAIAGVLAMEPSVLVLDEPTAGLDPGSREDILRMIDTLHREGTTIVMISHNMDDVARWASRVIVMEKGGIAMEGAPETIFTRGEELTALGLDVPQCSRLGILLREAGLDFPECWLPEDTLKALEELLGGGRHAC